MPDRQDTVKPSWQPSLPILMLFSLLVLVVVSLQSYHFAGRSYRQDEAWSVHWGIVHGEDNGGVLGTGLRNLSSYASENLISDIWVHLVGQMEPATRFLGALFAALTLALVFRLSKDLFDSRVGLFAVFLLGTLPFFQFFARDFRPYPGLIAGVGALLLFFERWLVQRRPIYMLLYTFSAVFTIYMHLYIIYVIAAQVIFFVVFTRWNRRFWVQTIAGMVLVALLLLPRFYIVFTHYGGEGINWYNLTTNFTALQILYEQMQINPDAIGMMLLLTGITIPISRLFPRLPIVKQLRLASRNEWRRAYLFFMPLTALVLALVANILVANLTPRNLIILLPPLAILAAYALLSFPWQARAIVVILVAIPALTTFRVYIFNGPYLEMTSFIRENFTSEDRFLIEGNELWKHVPITYYVRERLPERIANGKLFHLMIADGMGHEGMPDPPISWVNNDSQEGIQQFHTFINNVQRIWYLQDTAVSFGAAYQAILDAEFIPYRSIQYGAFYTYTEYRRIPDHLENPYVFGANFHLRHWELKNSTAVAPCQTVTLESWWTMERMPVTNYSMTMVAVDPNQLGMSRNDMLLANTFTKQWQPGQFYLDIRAITIPCDTERGEYPLLINLYDYETLESLPIALADGTPQNAGYLTTLYVENGS